eukprot:TRINITY_DN26028_c0_g1_i1.p1 TRINITY_DN26028_c0_g1~~TRINITY_DN26028_c0_g1_i1.p1  ORF type:complete len:182 (-),score=53.41 TRINITY_DN26028_c0_g1_i1:77-622(-)
MLKNLDDASWNDRNSEKEYNVSFHSFQASKQDTKEVEKLVRVISLLDTDCIPSFQASKYSSGDHIAPHDDKGFQDVLLDDGRIEIYSRDVACIYYLTKDWKEDWGGNFVDLVEDKLYVPEFNSLVAFQVPRLHEVTPVTSTHSRYAIFGWFLKPGMLYKMDEEEEKETPNPLTHNLVLPSQ